MERAVELLRVYHLPQKEVALLTGYPDVCAFSRMFKRKFGISPGQYANK
jgi:AraC-like DNA-binding protein